MKKKFKEVHVYARSNVDTFVKITVSGEVADLRDLIEEALVKILKLDNGYKKFTVENIDSYHIKNTWHKIICILAKKENVTSGENS